MDIVTSVILDPRVELKCSVSNLLNGNIVYLISINGDSKPEN